MASSPSTAIFTLPSSKSQFSGPLETFKSTHPQLMHFAASAFIFAQSPFCSSSTTPSSTLRLLILQRAASDAFGGLWDFPGGKIDETDATLLEGVRRELQEETGLEISASEESCLRFVGMHSWEEGVSRWAKFTFLVMRSSPGEGGQLNDETNSGYPEIKLQPKEHQALQWVEEAEMQRCLDSYGEQGVKDFISRENVEMALEAFRVYKAGL